MEGTSGIPRRKCKHNSHAIAAPSARYASGIYRVMDVAKFEEALYVLHCFQKKTQITGKQDKAIAGARYRAMVNAKKENK